ncbi:hypothetical protein CRI94_09570 [Longibacter salinarum]|uniref:Uncharacterized protein n=1 Tax=Longibacter salinarum TaxID=1850348 RepID=A0A2A8CY45_9BACT|nr:hypothetical protein [Longibacter salinarum]PEN13550.1 hypothetical protein CRI94_09570 [Longibacter salinarum]
MRVIQGARYGEETSSMRQRRPIDLETRDEERVPVHLDPVDMDVRADRVSAVRKGTQERTSWLKLDLTGSSAITVSLLPSLTQRAIWREGTYGRRTRGCRIRRRMVAEYVTRVSVRQEIRLRRSTVPFI